ncbi:hypothetical protein CHLRE_17g725550v5 [Chlamydomonas reinhardtii]|uniref:glucose-6-phosphate dehydrogenase (NADP(+)) n=1 Tax=Chlamydomonas reinhardtii TaxID=3055 RepID=A0A2K3CQK6_CHLRE|nr:uncharacterized protein CHLRE_17g725550v5 [Chlamydomonas reinhardtii]PNW70574.1 hypothetical protein CHLRE_17g725550v5 [Chlamydomonas reinhardtii]
MLPSQTHAVDGFAWVEDISNISSSLYGCLFSQVDPHVWQPRLRLGTTSGDTVASTPIPNSLDHPWSHLRPFHFTFLLPAAHESDFCFKVWEASFPDNRAPFCLPPSSAALCHRLAPAAAYTPDRPALWSVLIPLRSMGAPWGTHVSRTTVRLHHHLAYLRENMLMLRFANPIFSAFFNRHYISNIQITFKEPFGTEGRGGYFDSYGIIRDVIQNHLAQVLALLTMEAPVSLHPDDIRDEKVKVLRCIAPAGLADCVLGQYAADKGQPGYLDDPTVNPGSRTPTFAAVRVFVRNERWDGVPIIIKAGKALNERLAAVRIQLRTPPASIFGPLDHMRNELVVRFQPGEAIYAKMVVKKPGLEMDFEMSELDLSYPERYKGVVIPDAYERLILDCIRGDQQHFVRRDELRAAWAIFTPLLHAIDAGAVPLHPYPYGSRGPAAVDQFITDSGYVRTEYSWQQSHPSQHSQAPAQAAAAGAAAGNGAGVEGVAAGAAPAPAGKL